MHDLAELPAERIATVVGRYYAMDRDQRWERTQKAFDAIVAGEGEHADDPVAAVRASYERGITDEFLEPIVLDGRPRLGADDAAIFFNFRPDRARQLTKLLLEAGVDVTTMTRYSDELDMPVAFGEQEVERDARRGARRARRYASCTSPRPRSTRTSPTSSTAAARRSGRGRRASSCRARATSPATTTSRRCRPREVAARFCEELERDGYRFAVINFANPDMVGHTGSIPAVVEGGRDRGRVPRPRRRGGRAAGRRRLITADHGNAEQMLEPDGVSPHTAHTTNPVPLVVTDPDVAPPRRRRAQRSGPDRARLPGAGNPYR